MNRMASHFEQLNFLATQAHLEQRIEVKQVVSPLRDKLETLGHLLTDLKGTPAIVFVAHRESVERVGAWLKQEGFASVMYHGGMGSGSA